MSYLVTLELLNGSELDLLDELIRNSDLAGYTIDSMKVEIKR